MKDDLSLLSYCRGRARRGQRSKTSKISRVSFLFIAKDIHSSSIKVGSLERGKNNLYFGMWVKTKHALREEQNNIENKEISGDFQNDGSAEVTLPLPT